MASDGEGSRSPRRFGTRKATSVEHARCAHCRNPIRGRQAYVRHARSDLSFHTDCWVLLHSTVQADYLARYEADGVGALVTPYSRTAMASWLPEAAIDEAVETLSEQLVVGSFDDDPMLSEDLRTGE
jgi:hypothetical protein